MAGLNRSDVDALGRLYEQAGTEAGYWRASRLYKSIAVIAVGLGFALRHDEMCDYYLKALDCLKHVRSESQPGALTIEIYCYSKLMFFNHTEAEASQERLLTIAEKGHLDVHREDLSGLMGSKFYMGCLLFGLFKSSKYSFSITFAQAKKAALLFMESCSHRGGEKALDSAAVGSFERSMILETSLFPVAYFSSCLMQWSEFQDYIANVTGELGARGREAYEAYLSFVFTPVLPFANADFSFGIL
jgi:hypothetical protein